MTPTDGSSGISAVKKGTRRALGESKSPKLSLVDDVSCNVCVKIRSVRDLQDVLVLGERREFFSCCENARKSSDACDDRIVVFLRTRPTRRGSAERARYESEVIQFDMQQDISTMRRRRILEET